ncbi:hypothetical protein, partial [Hansschlegelia zhihuaiae]|uniref:hypothetical protein n=1 Tax=Hansschlegelia zhihuaiae TaxID=405005 RepID=UPI0013E8BE66
MAEALTLAETDEAPPADGLLDGYARADGVYDEMLAADGSVRPHYREMIAALAAMSDAERVRRFASA